MELDKIKRKGQPPCRIAVAFYHPKDRKVKIECSHCSKEAVVDIDSDYIQTPCKEAFVKVHFKEMDNADKYDKWMGVDIEGSTQS